MIRKMHFKICELVCDKNINIYPDYMDVFSFVEKSWAIIIGYFYYASARGMMIVIYQFIMLFIWCDYTNNWCALIHGYTPMSFGNVVDQFHNECRFTHSWR